MFTETLTSLDRKKLERIFRQHRGSLARLAERAGVKRSAVSRWLAGEFVSAKLTGHATAYAAELKLRSQEKQ